MVIILKVDIYHKKGDGIADYFSAGGIQIILYTIIHPT